MQDNKFGEKAVANISMKADLKQQQQQQQQKQKTINVAIHEKPGFQTLHHAIMSYLKKDNVLFYICDCIQYT